VFVSGGAAMVLRLAANDQVWVAVSYDDRRLTFNNGVPYNLFAGILIYEVIE
jgi:hypothetical protein